MTPLTIAMFGLGPMGCALSRNLQSKGIQVQGYDIDEKARRKAESYGIPILSDLDSLNKADAVWVMVPDSKVDEVLCAIEGKLPTGKIILEGGNSHFKDTERRVRWAHEKGFAYVGTGVSGGEEGALKGPCMMPGGDRDAYEKVRPILEAIAAKTQNGPCVAYMGPGGAGHFVKTVHNGIEYAIMQAIGEIYHLLSLSCKPEDQIEFFKKMSENTTAGGFLFDITTDILKTTDPTNGDQPLVAAILDKAGQKGTGKWASQIAYDLGVPVPSISAALNARILSSYKDLRTEASGKLQLQQCDRPEISLSAQTCARALTSAMICAYQQGFHMLCQGSKEYGYDLSLRDISRIWQGGCIIRSPMLGLAEDTFDKNPDNHLIFNKDAEIDLHIEELRKTVTTASALGIPTPVLSATRDYYDMIRTEVLPGIQLIQAQRDYFGAHTYQRLDREGTFHIDWAEPQRKEEKKNT